VAAPAGWLFWNLMKNIKIATALALNRSAHRRS
jgi:hypothetical protein